MNRRLAGTLARSVVLTFAFACIGAIHAQEPEREFSDRSGKFRTHAAVVQQNETKVKLRRTDGAEIIVDIEKLSDADQQYLRQRLEGVDEAGAAAMAVGDAVEIQFGRRWYPGVVLRRETHRAFVSYDGYSDSWNQWTSLDKLRLPERADASGAVDRAAAPSRDDAKSQVPADSRRLSQRRDRRTAPREPIVSQRLHQTLGASQKEQPATPLASEKHQAKPVDNDDRIPVRVRISIKDAEQYRDRIEQMVDRNCAANGWKRLPPDPRDRDSLQLTVYFSQSPHSVELRGVGIQSLLGNNKPITLTLTYFNIMLKKGNDLIYLGHQQLDATKLGGVFKDRFGQTAEEQMKERVRFDPGIFEKLKIPSDLSRRHVQGKEALPLTDLAE